MHSVLQATFTSLDEGFLAETHFSSMVRCTPHPASTNTFATDSNTTSALLQDRASSAAGGVIVYLDFKAEKLWAGETGLSKQLVIGRLFHGLAAQRTEAVVLDNASGYDTSWDCLLYSLAYVSVIT